MNTDEHRFCKPDARLTSLGSGLLDGELILVMELRGFE